MKDHTPAVLLAGVAGLGLSIAMLVDGFAKQQKRRQERSDKSTQTATTAQPSAVAWEVDEEEVVDEVADEVADEGGSSRAESAGDEDIYMEEEGEEVDGVPPLPVDEKRGAGLLAAIKRAYRVSFAASDSALEKALPRAEQGPAVEPGAELSIK